MDVSPDGFVAIRCPGKRKHGGACLHILGEVPATWGPVVVVRLADRTKASRNVRVDRCEKCGAWAQITYRGLLAA